ncbi:MAG: WecB/TagA/CpsF family glycosyltransferase [Ignavibacteria bacterium]|jgi:N-acetylglucosaminyldiphosphoundecaprenol N-acetyl-beta-D-mannosaminyltransferase
MCSQKIDQLNILNLRINKILYSDLLNLIAEAIDNRIHLTITGANASTVNLSLNNSEFKNALDNIDYIHPDGIGVYLSSKFLYGANGFQSKITGSDFYYELINTAIKKQWSFFFFGDEDKTLNKIFSVYPELNIAGLHNGFEYENDKLLDMINKSGPDILIVGMGSPKQEEWIIKSKQKLDVKIIIAVGDGIKIFSGSKRRGPKILRKFGLEWLVRLFFDPKRLWKRYLIGNPLFIIRLLKYKFFIINNN